MRYLGPGSCLPNEAVVGSYEEQTQGRRDWTQSPKEEERGIDKVCSQAPGSSLPVL